MTPQGNDKHRLVRNTMSNAVAQGLSIASTFILMPFLIKDFGLTDYGVYMLAASVVAYSGLLDFGVSVALVKLLSQSDAERDPERASRFIGTSLAIYVVIGLSAAAFMGALALWGVDLFRLSPQSAALARTLFTISAVASLVIWPLTAWTHILGGLQRYDLTARVTAGVSLANAAAMAAVAFVGLGPVTLLALSYLAAITGGLVTAWICLREMRARGMRVGAATSDARKHILEFSSTIFIIQVSAVLIFQQTDKVVLGIFMGAASVALYEAASKLQGLVTQMVSLTNSAVVPAASQFHAEEREGSLQALYLRGTKYAAGFVTPIVVTLIVLAEPLFRTWLGAAFVPMTLVAQVFISHWLLTINTTVGHSIIMGTGRINRRIKNVLAVAAGNVALSVILVQRIGIMGVVLGTVIPFVIDFPIYMRFVLHSIKLSWSDWLRRVVLPVYPLLIVPIVVCIACRRAGFTETLVGVGMTGIASVGLFWLALMQFGFTPSEKEDVRSLFRARLQKRQPGA